MTCELVSIRAKINNQSADFEVESFHSMTHFLTSALFSTFGAESNFYGILIFDLLRGLFSNNLLYKALVLDNEHKSAPHLFEYK